MKWNMPGIQQAGQAQNARRQTMAGMLKEQLMGVMVDGLRQNIAQGRAEKLKAGLNRRVSDYKQLWEEFKGRNQDWETNPGSAFREFSNEQALQPGGYDVEAGNIVERDAQTYAEMDRRMGEARYQKERREELAREQAGDDAWTAKTRARTEKQWKRQDEDRANKVKEIDREKKKLAADEAAGLPALERRARIAELERDIMISEGSLASGMTPQQEANARRAAKLEGDEQKDKLEGLDAAAQQLRKDYDAAVKAAASADEEKTEAYSGLSAELQPRTQREGLEQARRISEGAQIEKGDLKGEEQRDLVGRGAFFGLGGWGGSALSRGYEQKEDGLYLNDESVEDAPSEEGHYERAYGPLFQMGGAMLQRSNPWLLNEERARFDNRLMSNIRDSQHGRRSLWRSKDFETGKALKTTRDFLLSDAGYQHRAMIAGSNYRDFISTQGDAVDRDLPREKRELGLVNYTNEMTQEEWKRYVNHAFTGEDTALHQELVEMGQYPRDFSRGGYSLEELRDRGASEDDVTRIERAEEARKIKRARVSELREKLDDATEARKKAKSGPEVEREALERLGVGPTRATQPAQATAVAAQPPAQAARITPSMVYASARAGTYSAAKGKSAEYAVGQKGLMASKKEQAASDRHWPRDKYFEVLVSNYPGKFYPPNERVTLNASGGEKVQIRPRFIYEAMVAQESSWDPSSEVDKAKGYAMLTKDGKSLSDVNEILVTKKGRSLGIDEPKENIAAGFLYFLKMLKDNDGDPYKAMLSYQSGQGNASALNRPLGEDGRTYIQSVMKRLGDPRLAVGK